MCYFVTFKRKKISFFIKLKGNLLINQQHIMHFCVELGIPAFTVIADTERFNIALIQNVKYTAFRDCRKPLIPGFFRMLPKYQKEAGFTCCAVIDGYADFVFLNRYGNPHNLCHTFCTRYCENETNLKVIQEIMGHRDIATAMEVYVEATKDAKLKSFQNLSGKQLGVS